MPWSLPITLSSGSWIPGPSCSALWSSLLSPCPSFPLNLLCLGIILPSVWCCTAWSVPVHWDSVYLHRECLGHPGSAGPPGSSVSHSGLSALSLWAEPGVRWSPGSASVSEGSACWKVGCLWGSGVCSRCLQGNDPIKRKQNGEKQCPGHCSCFCSGILLDFPQSRIFAPQYWRLL